MNKRFVAAIACMLMMCTLLPGAVFAVGEQSTMQLKTGGIADKDSVYYGNWNGNALEWIVLDADAGNATGDDDSLSDGTKSVLNSDAMFLITKDALGTDKYGNVYFDNTDPKSEAYQGSDAQGWCNAFEGSNLLPKELNAIIKTSKNDRAYATFYASSYESFKEAERILNDDRVFFLSAEEAEKYFTDNDARIAQYDNGTGEQNMAWWLRSPFRTTANYAGLVYPSGAVTHYSVGNAWAARPAFNLNLNSVLFSSVAGGKTSGVVGANSLQTQTANTKPASWKLTLKDSDRDAFTASPGTFEGDVLTINYEGATVYHDTTAPNEYVSAIITDRNISDPNCKIKYYGRITQPASANGTATINLAGKYSAGDKLYIFSEQYNGGNKTDYASPLRELPIKGTPDVRDVAEDNPNTGDDSNITLWAILAMIAALAAAGTIIARKRK